MSACLPHYPDSIRDGCGRCTGLTADGDGIDGDGVAVAGDGGHLGPVGVGVEGGRMGPADDVWRRVAIRQHGRHGAPRRADR